MALTKVKGSTWNVEDNKVVLNTLAVLRATANVEGIVNVLGYSGAGDGGGGLFRYDASDTTTPDNNGTVIVSSDGKRWKRVYSGSINVKWFGAKGDGSTNDSAVIQAAINYAQSIGAKLHIPAGTFRLASTVEFAASAFIEGEGRNLSTILVDDGITGLRFKGSHVHIRDLHLRCNRGASGTWSSTNSLGIWVRNGNNVKADNPSGYVAFVKLENVFLERFYESILIQGTYWVGLEEVMTLHDFYGVSINRYNSSWGGTTYSLRDVYLRGAGGTYSIPANSFGLYTNNVGDLTLDKVAADFYSYAGYIYSTSNIHAGIIYAEGCTNGIHIHTASQIGFVSQFFGFNNTNYDLKISYASITAVGLRGTNIVLDTDGYLTHIGGKFGGITGLGNNYISLQNNSGRRALVLPQGSELGLSTHHSWLASRRVGSLAGGAAGTVTLTITLGTAGNWVPLAIRYKCITQTENGSGSGSYHELLTTYAFYTFDVLVARTTTNVVGSGVVSVTSATRVGNTVVVVIAIAQSTAGPNTWGYVLDTEIQSGTSITSAVYS